MPASTAPDTSTTQRRAPIQTGAFAVAVVFVLVGVLGFVPGVTEPYGELGWAGAGSTAELLRVFQVSVLHNLFHLAFGIVGLLLVRTPLRARNYLLYGAGVYYALFLFGLNAAQSSINFIPLDYEDNALHHVLAIVMLVMSLTLDRGPDWVNTIRKGDATL